MSKDLRDTSTACVALLIAGTLVLAVSLQGFKALFILTVESLLVVTWLVIMCQQYTAKMTIPINGLTLVLTALWVWQLLSLWFGIALETSLYAFFLASSVQMSFWLYTLSSHKTVLWRYVKHAIVAIGVLSSVYAIIQFDIFHLPAKAFFVNQNSHGGFLAMIVLLLSASFLYYVSCVKEVKCLPSYSYVFALFIIYYAINLTLSRGAILGLLVGLAVLLLSTFKCASRRAILVLLLVVFSSFFAATKQSNHFMLTKSLEYKESHWSPRMNVWRSSWHLLQDSPWYGIGLGNFMSKYPAYSTPKDKTSKQYAHNDYLQIWIELGYPGLALVLMLGVGLLVYYVRFIFLNLKTDSERIEGAGLFSSIAAVAVHSAVSYNFYILPTLILLGLILGRFNHVATRAFSNTWTFVQKNHMTKQAYFSINTAFFLLPLVFFASLLCGDYFYGKAWQAVKARRFVLADDYLAKAKLLFDTSHLENTRAIIYMTAMGVLAKDKGEGRALLFQKTKEALINSKNLNPAKPAAYYYLGRLYLNNPMFSGFEYKRRAEDEFILALKQDPSYYLARFHYARILLENHRPIVAKKILEQGVSYGFPYDVHVTPYLKLLAKLRKDSGDIHGSDALLKRIVMFELAVKRAQGAIAPPSRGRG